MDEIGLSNAGKPGSTVSLQTLVRSIKDRTGSIKRKVKKTSRKAVIGVPLEGPAAQEAQRKVDYKLTKKAVSKWEPIIYRNRNISQLQFPLNQSALRFKIISNLLFSLLLFIILFFFFLYL